MSRWTARLQDVRRLLKSPEQYELSSGAIQRLKWFLFALEHGSNVSLTCRHFGISRSTFLRWVERFDASDVRTLEEHSRSPHTVNQPKTEREVIALIRTLRQEHPLLGKVPLHAMLRERYKIDISVSTVGRIITRHNLFFADTSAHREKRQTEETKAMGEISQTTPKEKPEADAPGGLPLLLDPRLTS